jgi:hypothetical protein
MSVTKKKKFKNTENRLDWRQLAIVCAAAPLMLLITGQVLEKFNY